jgi:DnaJ like chaperone protein
MKVGSRRLPPWLGKAVGAACGALWFAPSDWVWLGLGLGVVAGEGVDRLLARGRNPQLGAADSARFLLLGRLAKSDGRVSEAEIVATRAVMERLGLTAGQRRLAIAAFKHGKAVDAPVHAAMQVFEQGRRGAQSRAEVLNDLVALARVDLPVSPAQWALLWQVADCFEIPREQVAPELRPGGAPATLEAAYALLGVAPGVSAIELKRAYRRQMGLHHPDRLLARGASAAEVKAATERTHAVRQAYDRLRSQAAGG